MKIEVDIKKKYFLFLVTTILVLASIFGVYAVWSDSTTRVVSHNADDVKVTLSENNLNVDYSLQELITGGRIEVAPLPGQGDVYDGITNIIAYNTGGKICYAQIRINNQQYLPEESDIGCRQESGGIFVGPSTSSNYADPNNACGFAVAMVSEGSIVSDNCQNLFKLKYLTDGADLTAIKSFINAKFSKSYTNIEIIQSDYNIQGTNSPLSSVYCAGGSTFCNDFFDATFKIRAS